MEDFDNFNLYQSFRESAELTLKTMFGIELSGTLDEIEEGGNEA